MRGGLWIFPLHRHFTRVQLFRLGQIRKIRRIWSHLLSPLMLRQLVEELVLYPHSGCWVRYCASTRSSSSPAWLICLAEISGKVKLRRVICASEIAGSQLRRRDLVGFGLYVLEIAARSGAYSGWQQRGGAGVAAKRRCWRERGTRSLRSISGWTMRFGGGT
jgi:hypothetical protein